MSLSGSSVTAKMLLNHLCTSAQSCCGSSTGFHSNAPVLPTHGNCLSRSLEQKSTMTVRLWLWLILLSCFWSNTVLSPWPGVFFFFKKKSNKITNQRSLLEVKIRLSSSKKIQSGNFTFPSNGMVSAKEHNLSQYSNKACKNTSLCGSYPLLLQFNNNPAYDSLRWQTAYKKAAISVADISLTFYSSRLCSIFN